MKSIYIAGPITGIMAYKERFDEAEEWLTGMGWAVINPARLPIGLKPDQYMPICLAMLQAADAICLLHGWENSLGAKLERAFADYQGKEIFECVAGVPNLKWEAEGPSSVTASPCHLPPREGFGSAGSAGEGFGCGDNYCPIKP